MKAVGGGVAAATIVFKDLSYTKIKHAHEGCKGGGGRGGAAATRGCILGSIN